MRKTTDAGALLAILVFLSALGWVFGGDDVPVNPQQDVIRKLVGTWKGVEGYWKAGKKRLADEYTFTFTDRKEVQVTFGQYVYVGTYTIDVAQTPWQIDFIMMRAESSTGEKIDGATTLSIFEFTQEGKLRIAEWDPNHRRTQFSPAVLLRREVEKASNKRPEDTARHLADPQP